MTVPFFKTVLSERSISAVVEVLRSGWLTSGKQVSLFEEEFASYIGASMNAIAVNSATAGLHLALDAVGVGLDDEVIVPTLTFTASAEVADYLGAKVVLVDIDPRTLSGNLGEIEAAITSKTKAIVFVHFGGYPVDIAPLVALCRRYSLRLVEDAAHAIPCRVNDSHIGTNGSDAAVFSFYANKTMTTGEGGMIVTSCTKIANRTRLMRTHGIDRDAFARFNGKSHLWQYDVIEAGYKYNLTDIAAAIGRAQLAEIDDLRAVRQAAAAYYDKALVDLPFTLPPRPKGSSDEHSWHLYPIQCRGGRIVRDRIIDLFSSHDIGYSIHYTPLHQLSYWRKAAQIPEKGLSVADLYFESCLSLPLFPTITRVQQDKVIAVLKEAI